MKQGAQTMQGGYPYEVIIKPMQVKDIMVEFFRSPEDIKGHLSLWESFMLARKESKLSSACHWQWKITT